MSNPSTVFASSERPVDLEGSTGFSDGGQLVGGKGSIRATSSPKQGEEAAGLDALQIDMRILNKIAEEVSCFIYRHYVSVSLLAQLSICFK